MRGSRDRVLDEGAGKANPAVFAENRARSGQDLDARLRCIGKAHLLERIERGTMDSLDARVGQRAEQTSLEAGTDRSNVLGQGGRAQAVPGCPASCTA